ncbi:hypothetical protein Tco_1079957 [Tanacetum coccineum]|uniref:Uncharacterized protein n=1 Tax=Tanacetum coccineum TaxID=301880 RepID=A0ABQ5HTD0_9ASTR
MGSQTVHSSSAFVSCDAGDSTRLWIIDSGCLESIDWNLQLSNEIFENGVSRPKKYSELSATEAIQADYDIKATNIIIQGLPPEVYALSLQYGSPYQSQQYSTHQSSTPLSITLPSNDYQSSVHHNVYSPSSSIPQLEYAPTVNQQPEFSQPDSGLIVPVFQKGDDPIDAINHMMSFLTAVVTSRYPTTNNQLRNSLNPMQQATINDGRVTLQPIQGDTLLLMRVLQGAILQEQVEAILGNK